ncbi:MAG: hypothetical protein FJ261_11410 [Planctomycetes bacterium]|nr:hypothetical protein [Planctomycetota bacterium]
MSHSDNSIRIVPGFRYGRLFVVILAVAALAALGAVCAFTGNMEAVYFSPLPICVIAFTLLTWGDREPLVISEIGIEHGWSGKVVAFEDIEGITLNGACQDPDANLKGGWLAVHHRDGTLQLPPNTIPDNRHLYELLLSRCVPGKSIPGVETLADYHQGQVETFGEAMVWAFNPRRASPKRWHHLVLWLVLAGLAISWIALSVKPGENLRGGAPDPNPLAVGGGVLLIVSFFGVLVTAARLSAAGAIPAGVRGWKKSSLVIGPLGIGLVQGDLTGTITWVEIEDLGLARGFSLGTYSGFPTTRTLSVKVAGAVIAIADIYDHPLPNIFAIMSRFWKKPKN